MKVLNLFQILTITTTASALTHHECFLFEGHTGDSLTILNGADTPAGALVYKVSDKDLSRPSVLSFEERDLFWENGKFSLCTAERLTESKCPGPVGSVYRPGHVDDPHTSVLIGAHNSYHISLDHLEGVKSVCVLVYQNMSTAPFTKPPVLFEETHRHGHLPLSQWLKFRWTLLETMFVGVMLVWYFLRGMMRNEKRSKWDPHTHTMAGYTFVLVCVNTLFFDVVKLCAYVYYNSSGTITPLGELVFFGYCNMMDMLWLHLVIWTVCIRPSRRGAFWQMELRQTRNENVCCMPLPILLAVMYVGCIIIFIHKHTHLEGSTVSSASAMNWLFFLGLAVRLGSRCLLLEMCYDYFHYIREDAELVVWRQLDREVDELFHDFSYTDVFSCLFPTLSAYRSIAWIGLYFTTERLNSTDFLKPVRAIELIAPHTMYTKWWCELLMLFLGSECVFLPVCVCYLYCCSQAHVRTRKFLVYNYRI